MLESLFNKFATPPLTAAITSQLVCYGFAKIYTLLQFWFLIAYRIIGTSDV